jgi:hypothetical protein
MHRAPISSSISPLPTPRCAEPHYDPLGGFIKTSSGCGAILKRGNGIWEACLDLGALAAAHLGTKLEAAWFQLPDSNRCCRSPNAQVYQ